tara:strand:+ start:107 stop:352 length:246 start_codon:yes stop_codon:yes gene_type:complete
MKKLKSVPTSAKGLSKLPTSVRNKMGFYNDGGKVKGKFKKKVKKFAQNVKNKFRETVTKNDTRKVVNKMLSMKDGGIIQHD